MLKGFKDFIMRGNVIELATAVIIGSAFTAIVTAVTDSIIQPIINSLGSAEVDGLGFQITDNKNTLVDFGAVITAAINFLIIVPINKLTEAAKRRQGVDPEAPAPTSEELLAEIRDLLEAQKASTNGISHWCYRFYRHRYRFRFHWWSPPGLVFGDTQR